MLPRMAITLALVFTSSAALAAKPEPAGTFNAWSAWTYKESGKKNCYIYSAATTKSPARLNHGDVSFFVRTVNQPQAQTEANFTVGYDMAPGSTVRAIIGSNSFDMMVQGENAWLVAAEKEKELLAAMRGGDEMSIRATSRRGNETSYVFSLDGVTAAVRQMQKDCP